MDPGTGVWEVVGIHFSQQHRAFESLGLGQLRSFGFGQLEQGPADAASLRVTVAPPPVLDELPRGLHGFVFDPTGPYLSRRGRDAATFLANRQAPAATAALETVPTRVTAGLLGKGVGLASPPSN